MNIFKIIDSPVDTVEDRSMKRIALGIMYGSSINIVIEGTIAGIYGSASGQYFLYLFAAFCFIIPTLYLCTGHHQIYYRIGIYGVLFFQAGGQVFMGGFASSGAFIGWGICTILTGAIVLPSKEKFAPPVLYFIILTALGIFDPYIRKTQPQLHPTGSLILFMIFFITISIMVFSIIYIYLMALMKERSRSESLLLNILPGSIAARLKGGEGTIADLHREVTVLFTDMVGFTQFAETLEPSRLVEILNEYFSVFDRLTDEYGIEKIKTIGDAYFAVAGLPEKNSNHACAMAGFALNLKDELARLNAKLNVDLNLRIGMHTGPVVAGVIGMKKFTYDLWGDTVNIAARMESHGVAGEIQLTERTAKLLKNDFVVERRGRIHVKGKHDMEVFLLKGFR
ncbi:MAG: adenylate/guanylate cyclase domain-containing protein [Desulfococcus multivorans]|jgi:class 3 adenylate cyclase|nr:adenylate/guanylate cyclase domain-containing protein [Desulfococcus multivorans]